MKIFSAIFALISITFMTQAFASSMIMVNAWSYTCKELKELIKKEDEKGKGVILKYSQALGEARSVVIGFGSQTRCEELFVNNVLLEEGAVLALRSSNRYCHQIECVERRDGP